MSHAEKNNPDKGNIEKHNPDTKLQVKTEKPPSDKSRSLPLSWHPLESLRRQVDRLFDDFSLGSLRLRSGQSPFELEPFWRRDLIGHSLPAADIIDKEQAIDIKLELPGMDQQDIDVTLSNGNLCIRGEKREETEQTQQNYYLSERRFGAFERTFSLPEGVDAEQIDARFEKGVLTLHLPKKPEAMQSEKRISIKAS